MSIAGILTNFIIRLVRLISNSCRRAVEFCRFGRSGAPRIAELPFVRPKEERQSFDSQSASLSPQFNHTDSWNTWDDKTFGIQTKIAEYRQQVQHHRHPAVSNQANNVPQEDLFSDLQPKLKAAKTYRIHDPNIVQQAPRRSIFEVKEMDAFSNRQFSNELGEIDLNASSAGFNTSSEANSWDTDDVPDLDTALNEQKKREINEKRLKRQEEHQRQLQEKRQKNH